MVFINEDLDLRWRWRRGEAEVRVKRDGIRKKGRNSNVGLCILVYIVVGSGW